MVCPERLDPDPVCPKRDDKDLRECGNSSVIETFPHLKKNHCYLCIA